MSEGAANVAAAHEVGVARSVVVPRLKKVNAVLLHEINDAMLISQPPRPHVSPKPFQRLRLPDSDERITKDRLHEIEQSQSEFAIVGNEIGEILNESRVEDRFAHSCCRHESPTR